MPEPSKELEELIERLKCQEISKEEFERRSTELVESIGSDETTVQPDPVRLERIHAAAKMARNL